MSEPLGFRYVGLTPLKKVRKLCGEAGDDAHARAHTHTPTHTHTHTHTNIYAHTYTHMHTHHHCQLQVMIAVELPIGTTLCQNDGVAPSLWIEIFLLQTLCLFKLLQQ